jgi:uncharacterized protein (TIGR04255 family)
LFRASLCPGNCGQLQKGKKKMTTYPKNFITQVIAKVDFEPILRLKEEPPYSFQEAIKEWFPRSDQAESVEFLLKPGEEPSAIKKPISYLFFNKEKTEKIEVNYQTIILTLGQYLEFDSFISKIELMYNNFNEIYHPSIIKRIGLRFVNEIKLRGNPFEWEGYLNNNLYCMINAFPDLTESLSRIMAQMIIALEGRRIIFNFGIYNSEFPNTITQKEFILDYDCASVEECEPEVALGKFRLFYEDIKKLFKQNRGEKLIKIMKGENNEGL